MAKIRVVKDLLGNSSKVLVLYFSVAVNAVTASYTVWSTHFEEVSTMILWDENLQVPLHVLRLYLNTYMTCF